MKYQDVARFEFRVFASDLMAVRNAFATLGASAEQPESRETYIMTRLNVDSNVKIRADRLEVKGLLGRLRLLEQWQPIFKSAFPVPAGDIENVVAPALGLDVELGAAPPLSEAALLVFAAEQPSLASVVVDKQRTLFDLGDCEAEFAELVIGDEQVQTVAIESPEAHAAEALLKRVGLDQMQNESYSVLLQRRLFSIAR
ncbi:MAG TPA: hypothetical protein VGA65_05425 [Hyphomicrobium sp.]